MTSFDAFAFGARGTLAGVPKATIDDLDDAAAVVVGAPLDWGTTYRPGARFGPAAIRDADPLDRDGSRPNLATGLDPLGALKVVDVGDVRVVPGYRDESLERIRAAVAAIAGPSRKRRPAPWLGSPTPSARRRLPSPPRRP